MATADSPPAEPPRPRLDPFRRAVLSGLAVLLPPLLTVAIFLWVGSTVARYVLEPLTDATRYVLVEFLSDIRSAEELTAGAAPGQTGPGGKAKPPGEKVVAADKSVFRRAPDGMYLPEGVYETVRGELRRKEAEPATAREWYGRYVDHVWLRPWIVIPIFLSVFLLLLYTVGKFLAAGIGRFFYRQCESLVTRVPLVSNVYTSVKQVTDLVFAEPDIDITRIIAIEYPRKGIWTLAFVTGESMLDIEAAANEPVMSILVPTSPMPFTGFTMSVKKSETIDLNITLDQAFQFIVSCGVVTPTHQLTRAAAERGRRNPVTVGANGAQESDGDAPGFANSPAEARRRVTEAIQRQAEEDRRDDQHAEGRDAGGE